MNRRLSWLLVVVFSGCGPAVVGTWAVSTIESRTASSSPWTPASDRSCTLDDVEEYEAGGNYALFPGSERCGSGSTGALTGTWRLAASDTRLVFTYDDSSGEYETTVETLTPTEFVKSWQTGLSSGLQFRQTLRRVK